MTIRVNLITTIWFSLLIVSLLFMSGCAKTDDRAGDEWEHSWVFIPMPEDADNMLHPKYQLSGLVFENDPYVIDNIITTNGWTCEIDTKGKQTLVETTYLDYMNDILYISGSFLDVSPRIPNTKTTDIIFDPYSHDFILKQGRQYNLNLLYRLWRWSLDRIEPKLHFTSSGLFVVYETGMNYPATLNAKSFHVNPSGNALFPLEDKSLIYISPEDFMYSDWKGIYTTLWYTFSIPNNSCENWYYNYSAANNLVLNACMWGGYVERHKYYTEAFIYEGYDKIITFTGGVGYYFPSHGDYSPDINSHQDRYALFPMRDVAYIYNWNTIAFYAQKDDRRYRVVCSNNDRKEDKPLPSETNKLLNTLGLSNFRKNPNNSISIDMHSMLWYDVIQEPSYILRGDVYTDSVIDLTHIRILAFDPYGKMIDNYILQSQKWDRWNYNINIKNKNIYTQPWEYSYTAIAVFDDSSRDVDYFSLVLERKESDDGTYTVSKDDVCFLPDGVYYDELDMEIGDHIKLRWVQSRTPSFIKEWDNIYWVYSYFSYWGDISLLYGKKSWQSFAYRYDCNQKVAESTLLSHVKTNTEDFDAGIISYEKWLINIWIAFKSDDQVDDKWKYFRDNRIWDVKKNKLQIKESNIEIRSRRLDL